MKRPLHENKVIIHLQTCQVRARKEARPLVAKQIKELAKSISEVGLLSPILVRRTSKADDAIQVYELVAGRHRYAACSQLNLTTIPAIIVDADDLHVELIEIDENLCRKNLSPAQEALAVARRKQIYEQLHPETKHGGSRTPSRQSGVLKSIQKSMKRFSAATAAQTGRGERSIQRIAHRGENIDPAALAKIDGTSLDKCSELDALSKLSVPEQKRLIDLAASGAEVSARPASTIAPSAEWRRNFKNLIDAAPTEADREWAAEQLAIPTASRMPDLDRKIPEA
jgi:hypothetical protein